MNDPFFSDAEVTQLSIQFTNQIAQVTPTNGWSYSSVVGWQYNGNYPARPFSETFLARSSETSYRLAPMTNWLGAGVVMALHLSGDYPGSAQGVYSDVVFGIASMPCLVPCRPDDADGSPTNYVFSLKLLPDINLNGLIQTNGNVYGVDFTWTNSPATFLLQGSADMKSWTNINYLWSDPPEEVWTTNTSLSSYGNFFRVELVADGHQTNLPPLSSAVAVPTPNAGPVTKGKFATAPNITSCRPAGGRIVVSVSAQAGQTVQVQALTPGGQVGTIANGFGIDQFGDGQF